MLSDRIWDPFERKAAVLDHFGYLDLKAKPSPRAANGLRTFASIARCLSAKR